MLSLLKIARHLPFILFTFCSAVSFAQDGIINGTVKDGETVLQSATISIAKKTIVTNSKGEFFVTLKAGTYSIIITYAGYKKNEQSFTLNAGETKHFNLTW